MSQASHTETSDYVFEIRSGLYRGVTHDLGEGRHVVGSGEGADLLLVEPDLAAQHAAIVLQGETIRVEGLAEGVSIEGAGPVPAGAARTVRLPAAIAIGSVETVWHERSKAAVAAPTTGPFSQIRSLLSRPAVPGIAAAGILAITTILTISNPIAGAAVLLDGSARTALEKVGLSKAAKDAPAPQAAAPATSAKAEAAPAPMQQAAVEAPAQERKPETARRPNVSLTPSKGSVESAATALKRQVEQAGLLNVHVSAGGGAVAAAGTIEPSMSSRWEALQKDFDERFVGEITLINSVAVKAEKLPSSLGIEGVWRGPQPYIVIRGQRYLVGAIVDGGWAIRDIERDRVMLEREGRLVAMRF